MAHFDAYNTSETKAKRVEYNSTLTNPPLHSFVGPKAKSDNKEEFKGGPEEVSLFPALKEKEVVILGPLQTDRSTKVSGSVWCESVVGTPKVYLEQSFDWQYNKVRETSAEATSGNAVLKGVAESAFEGLSEGTKLLPIPGVIAENTYITKLTKGSKEIELSTKAKATGNIWAIFQGLGHWDILKEFTPKKEEGVAIYEEAFAPLVRVRFVNGSAEQKELRLSARTFSRSNAQ